MLLLERCDAQISKTAQSNKMLLRFCAARGYRLQHRRACGPGAGSWQDPELASAGFARLGMQTGLSTFELSLQQQNLDIENQEPETGASKPQADAGGPILMQLP
jgi:hypothetical protein